MSIDRNVALIEFDTFLEYKGQEAPEKEKQTAVELIINGVSVAVTKYLGRELLAPAAAITELIDGDGESNAYAKNVPILASPTPKLEYGNGSSWTEIATTFYAYVSETGELYFHDSIFSEGKRNYRLTYKYGYTVEQMPRDIVLAVCQLVDRAIMLAEDKQGLNSLSFGTSSTSYNLNELLDNNVKMLLQPYRRLTLL